MMEAFGLYAYEAKESLEQMNLLLESYTPVDAKTLFFEEGEDAEASATAGGGIVKAFKNAVAKVKAMIMKAIDSVTTWMQTAFMDKNEKDRFIKFKEEMKANPEFANKKITVKNFRAIEKAYKQALEEVDKAIKESENATAERAAEIAEATKNKINTIVSEAQKSAAMVVTKDLALRMCEGNRDVAKWISKRLQSENFAVKALEKQLGTERTADFKKKAKSCSNLLSLHRLKVLLLGQYHKTTSGAIDQVFTDLGDIASLKPDKLAKQTTVIDDALGSLNTKAGTNVKKRDIIKGVNEIKTAQKMASKRKDQFEKKARKAADDAAQTAKRVKNYLLS